MIGDVNIKESAIVREITSLEIELSNGKLQLNKLNDDDIKIEVKFNSGAYSKLYLPLESLRAAVELLSDKEDIDCKCI